MLKLNNNFKNTKKTNSVNYVQPMLTLHISR